MAISAKIIQDSISRGIRITTFELTYPRFIHAELMTHRAFSRNAASSRAIPIEKMLHHIAAEHAEPIHWGMNQAGMQAKQELKGNELAHARQAWNHAALSAVSHSRNMSELNLHKQIANRVTEPFQTMKTIVTATEYDNWFWLRNHTDAQPEIHELAKLMKQARDESFPMILYSGEWHVPYIDRARDYVDNIIVYSVNGIELDVEKAKKISASCCAQVSYRKLDDSIEKAEMVFDRLSNSVPVHASPVEHQATPCIDLIGGHDEDWQLGVTHMDRFGELWSGNFKGWIQFRQLIPNNVCTNY